MNFLELYKKWNHLVYVYSVLNYFISSAYFELKFFYFKFLIEEAEVIDLRSFFSNIVVWCYKCPSKHCSSCILQICMSHIFISLSLKYFQIFLSDLLSSDRLFRSMLFSKYSEIFPYLFLLPIFNLTPLWSENTFHMTWIL